MLVGKVLKSPIYTGDNYDEIIDSLPFYITRDDQEGMDKDSFYSIQRRLGKPHICSGQCPDSKDVHFFTNIGILELDVGECLEFMDIE